MIFKLDYISTLAAYSLLQRINDDHAASRATQMSMNHTAEDCHRILCTLLCEQYELNTFLEYFIFSSMGVLISNKKIGSRNCTDGPIYTRFIALSVRKKAL